MRGPSSACLLVWLASLALAHPYHVSSTELVYDRDSGRLAGTLRVFADDLEGSLRERLQRRVQLEEGAELEPLLAELVEAGISLRGAGEQEHPAAFIGWHLEGTRAVLQFSLPALFGLPGLELRNALLCDRLPDQSNLVQLTVEGARETLLCSAEEPWQPVSLQLPPTGELSVRSLGERGPTLLLLPGVGCDARFFEPFMQRHAQRYQMHACNLPGTAGSPLPEGLDPDWRSGAWLAHAERAVHLWLRSQGEPSVVLLGHGLGGLLAARLAVAFPERFVAVVALDAWHPLQLARLEPTAQRPLCERVAQRQAALSDEAWWQQRLASVQVWSGDALRSEELLEMQRRVPREVQARYQLEWFDSRLDAELRSLGGRLLNLEATLDAAASEAAFPGAVQVRVEGAGHALLDDAPAQVDAALAEFLSGLEGR